MKIYGTTFKKLSHKIINESQKQKGKLLIAYNRGWAENIEDIINSGTFQSSDQLFGPGLYLNRDIHRTIGSRYGKYVTEVGIMDADRYLHLDWDTYVESGKRYGGKEENWDFIWKQLESAGVTGDEIVHGTENYKNHTFRDVVNYALKNNRFESDTYLGGKTIDGNTSMLTRWAICISFGVYSKVRRYFKGIFYTGRKDRECVVVFDPSSVTVLGVVEADRENPEFNDWYNDKAGFDVNHTVNWTEDQTENVYGIPDDEIKDKIGLFNNIANGERKDSNFDVFNRRISSRVVPDISKFKEPIDDWRDVVKNIADNSDGSRSHIYNELLKSIKKHGLNSLDGRYFMSDLKRGGYRVGYGKSVPLTVNRITGENIRTAVEDMIEEDPNNKDVYYTMLDILDGFKNKRRR